MKLSPAPPRKCLQMQNGIYQELKSRWTTVFSTNIMQTYNSTCESVHNDITIYMYLSFLFIAESKWIMRSIACIDTSIPQRE